MSKGESGMEEERGGLGEEESRQKKKKNMRRKSPYAKSKGSRGKERERSHPWGEEAEGTPTRKKKRIRKEERAKLKEVVEEVVYESRIGVNRGTKTVKTQLMRRERGMGGKSKKTINLRSLSSQS